MQIFRTSSDISTPEKLALVISNQSIARYKDIPDTPRKTWIGSQIYGLCMILHYQAPAAFDVAIDAEMADQMIMEDTALRSLKQVEMQEAFRRGIAKEYGEFYGITASSLVQFLKGYIRGEKRADAMALLYKKEQKKREDEDKLFWQTLARAREDGMIELPEFQHSPFEDDKQHRERIEQQRKDIESCLTKTKGQ